MVNKDLIRPYFWGGYVRGGWLISHKFIPGDIHSKPCSINTNCFASLDPGNQSGAATQWQQRLFMQLLVAVRMPNCEVCLQSTD